jgi:GNAT superfamily N-acetyltransferase
MSEIAEQIEVRLLTTDEVAGLAPVFASEFGDDALPRPTEARVVGAFDAEGRLVGFIVVEELLHLAQMYVEEEARGGGVGSALASYVERSIPAGRSAIVVAQSEDGERMAEAWGFQPIPGKLYRREK